MLLNIHIYEIEALLNTHSNQIPTSAESRLLKSKYRILIAEDNEDLRQILSDLFHTIGYPVQIANNGQDAFDIITSKSSGPFDAVLSDINMPKMDGFEFLTKLRQHGFNLPFIFMTAAPTTENMSRAADLGIKDILEKPFGVEELQLCLNKIFHVEQI